MVGTVLVLRLLIQVPVMDDSMFNGLLRGVSRMASDGEPASADTVLEQLQKAVEEQAKILDRQSRLIRRLRAELSGVEGHE